MAPPPSPLNIFIFPKFQMYIAPLLYAPLEIYVQTVHAFVSLEVKFELLGSG